MRRAMLLICSLLGMPAAHAQDVRINEVLCAHAWNDTIHGDRIELYNSGRTAIDLADHTIALNGASHRLQGPLLIPAHGFRVLWCDRHPDKGNDHLDLKLPRNGGSVLLIAPDRMHVLDVFTWPALPPGVSMGRTPDGARTWGYFAQPTPGAPNTTDAACKRLLPPPTLVVDGDLATLTCAPDATVHYTLDGTPPDRNASRYQAPVTVHAGQVLRARTFATNAIPSAEVTYTLGLPADAIALTVDPAMLWDAQQGLFAGDNYTRRGHAWERPVAAEWSMGGVRHSGAFGLAVSGSGTRSAPKKNLKLLARDRFASAGMPPWAGGSDEVMLRADATPYALLRNLFMERVAQRSGARVDVQPSTVVPLFLNGAPFGTFRAMPAKNTAWVQTIGHAEAVDLIDGPGGHVIAGSDAYHVRAIAALQRHAPIDTLEQWVDVNSLIELACFDLWTGRADHDLNVRCWRPRTHEGRFRWILYDMDLWAPADEHTVDRMLDATTLEAPYLDQLLAHPALRERLLQRTATLLATTLSPTWSNPLADSLYHANAFLMDADRDRWNAQLQRPSAAECVAVLHAHIQARGPLLMDQLARRTGNTVRTVTVSVEPANSGTITVDGLVVTGTTAEVALFSRVPMTFTATPAPDMEFVGWKGANDASPTTTVMPGRTKNLRAVFRPAGGSRRNGL